MPLSSFFIATLALNLAPGPDMTYVAAGSLGQGRRAGLISALDIGAGCLFHVVAAAAGVAVVLRAWPHAYSFIRWIGAGYLLYLGVGLWRAAGRGEGLTSVAAASEAAIFRQGVITNVLNPKVGIFFLAGARGFNARAAPSSSRSACAWHWPARASVQHKGHASPLTPVFRDLNTIGFSQETRPGK